MTLLAGSVVVTYRMSILASRLDFWEVISGVEARSWGYHGAPKGIWCLIKELTEYPLFLLRIHMLVVLSGSTSRPISGGFSCWRSHTESWRLLWSLILILVWKPITLLLKCLSFVGKQYLLISVVNHFHLLQVFQVIYLLERTNNYVLSLRYRVLLTWSQLRDAVSVAACQVERAVLGPATTPTRENADILLPHDLRHICIGLMKFIAFVFQDFIELLRYLLNILGSDRILVESFVGSCEKLILLSNSLMTLVLELGQPVPSEIRVLI